MQILPGSNTERKVLNLPPVKFKIMKLTNAFFLLCAFGIIVMGSASTFKKKFKLPEKPSFRRLSFGKKHPEMSNRVLADYFFRSEDSDSESGDLPISPKRERHWIEGSEGSESSDLYSQKHKRHRIQLDVGKSKICPKSNSSREDVLRVLTRVYIWITVNPEKSLQPLVKALKRMTTNNELKELSRGELQEFLTNFIIDNVLGQTSPLRISDIERVLLASFLLAPMLTTSDDYYLEILEDQMLRTRVGLEQFKLKAYFIFIKSCVICHEDKKSFLENLKGKKIDATADDKKVFDDFFKGKARGSGLYDSLIQMYGILRDHDEMTNFFATFPESEKGNLLKLSNKIGDFLDRVIP